MSRLRIEILQRGNIILHLLLEARFYNSVGCRYYCLHLSAAGPGKLILISYKREVSTKLGQKRKVVF